MTVDARPTIAAPDDDPYLWLEDIDGEPALAWVDGQNRATLGKFATHQFAADRDTLAGILDRPDNIPFVTRRGPYLYNVWKDARNPRGLWRRTTLDSFRTAQPVWDILLDVDALAASEKEDWVWHGASTLPGSHDLAILALSRGGGDACALREFDIAAKAFVNDGFCLPEAKGFAAWLDRDTLLLSSSYGPGMATTSGYARTVRLWRRGANVEQIPMLHETTPASMGLWASVDRTRTSETVWFVDRPGFFDCIIWLGDRTGAKVRLDLPTDIGLDTHRNWMAVKRRTAWTVGGKTHAPDTVLGMALSDFIDGSREFTVLFEPSERRALQHFFWNDGQLILSILDELKPVFEVITPSPSGWARSKLTGLPQIGVVSVWRLDMEEAEGNGDLLADAQDPLTPATMSLIERGKSPAVLRQAPRTFNAHGLVVTHHEAVSIDGERIPYVQVGPPGETGDAPVHLNGYGGFAVSQLPYYSSAIGKLWLERGGTSVTANIRGGGEFGTRWHEAGRRGKKPLSHDDFAAVAADLARRGVTRPQRIAAEGGSNGGILITNMLTRYPERFGALFCTIPLIDMRRYSKLLAGASWIAEYGDPDKPEDWAFLQTYSAYHQAAPGRGYVPILIATTRRDDRVHPGHARKMAAKLQAMGYEAYLYEPAAGGHGYGKDNKERAAFTALGLAFLRDKIGWSSGA
ncbi:MAG TPA: prolyl oligopeptidase family serine peptidase [Hyphomicrobiaceae bacterium]|nr:prolyl oligopeptidase family serine peptidase [Hyphomicrobiaceae bacterium]